MDNIPPPPPGDLGSIPAPPGFGRAYVPAMVATGAMEKPEAAAAVTDEYGSNLFGRRASAWGAKKYGADAPSGMWDD